MAGWRARLLAERETRVWPGLDDKVLTSWNGLALAAFAEAGRVLGEPAYVAIAERNAAFVRAEMWRDGRLLHTWKDGRARVDGLIEDYTYYGLGLIELYRATGNLDHLHWAAELLEVVVARFRDPEGGGVYESASDAERLILRQKPLFDAASPSGNGAAALLAFWLGRYFGRPEWEALAREVVALTSDHLVQAASGFGSVLQVVDLLLAPPREIAIVGDASARAPFEARDREPLPAGGAARSRRWRGPPGARRPRDGRWAQPPPTSAKTWSATSRRRPSRTSWRSSPDRRALDPRAVDTASWCA